MKFCILCNNLLVSNIINNILVFRCTPCNKIYQSDENDLLLVRIYVRASTQESVNENLVRYAPYDRSMPRIEHKCKKCTEQYPTYIRDNSMRRIVVCKCGHYEYI